MNTPIPDIWEYWGLQFPLMPDHRDRPIPTLWRENPWLGEARSDAVFSPDGLRSIQWFQKGGIYHEKDVPEASLIVTYRPVP